MIKFTYFYNVLYFPFPYGYLYANSHRFNSQGGLEEALILLLKLTSGNVQAGGRIK